MRKTQTAIKLTRYVATIHKVYIINIPYHIYSIHVFERRKLLQRSKDFVVNKYGTID